jgi:hypothetical protein
MYIFEEKQIQIQINTDTCIVLVSPWVAWKGRDRLCEGQRRV